MGWLRSRSLIAVISALALVTIFALLSEQSLYQSINQSISQSAYSYRSRFFHTDQQSVDRNANGYLMTGFLTYPEAAHQSINQSINQSSKPSIKQAIDQSVIPTQGIRRHYDDALSTLYEYSIDHSPDPSQSQYIEFQINRSGEFDWLIDTLASEQSIDDAKRRLHDLINQPSDSIEHSIYQSIYRSIDQLQFQQSKCDSDGRYLVYDWINEYTLTNPFCESSQSHKRPSKRSNKILSLRELKEKTAKKQQSVKRSKAKSTNQFISMKTSNLSDDCLLSPLLEVIKALMIAQASQRQLVVRPISPSVCKSIEYSIDETNISDIFRMIYPQWHNETINQSINQPFNQGLAASLWIGCNFNQLVQPIHHCSYQSVSTLMNQYGYHEDPFYGITTIEPSNVVSTPVAIYQPLQWCHVDDDLFNYTFARLRSVDPSMHPSIGRLTYFQGLTNFVLNPNRELIDRSTQLGKSINQSIHSSSRSTHGSVMTLYVQKHSLRPLLDEQSIDRSVDLLRDQSISFGIDQAILWIDQSINQSIDVAFNQSFIYAEAIKHRLPGLAIHILNPVTSTNPSSTDYVSFALSKLLVLSKLSSVSITDTDTSTGLLTHQSINLPSTDQSIQVSSYRSNRLVDVHNDQWYHDCPSFSWRFKIIPSVDTSFKQSHIGINQMRSYPTAMPSLGSINVVNVHQPITPSSNQPIDRSADHLFRRSKKSISIFFLVGLDHQEIEPLQSLFDQLPCRQPVAQHSNLTNLLSRLFHIPQTVDQYAQTRQFFIRALEQEISQSIDRSDHSADESSVIRIDWSPNNMNRAYQSIIRPRIGLLVRMIDRLRDRYSIQLKFLIATRSFENVVYQSINQSHNVVSPQSLQQPAQKSGDPVIDQSDELSIKQSANRPTTRSDDILYAARVIRDQSMALTGDLKSIDQSVIPPISPSSDMTYLSIYQSVYQVINMDELDDQAIDQSVNALKIASSINQLTCYQSTKQWLVAKQSINLARPKRVPFTNEQLTAVHELSISLFDNIDSYVFSSIIQSNNQSIDHVVNEMIRLESERSRNQPIYQPVSISQSLVSLQRGSAISGQQHGRTAEQSVSQCQSTNFLVFDLFTAGFPCSCDQSISQSYDRSSTNELNRQSILAQSIRGIGRSLSLALSTNRCLIIPSVIQSVSQLDDHSLSYLHSINKAVESINQSNCSLSDLGLQLTCQCEKQEWKIEPISQSVSSENYQSLSYADDLSVKVVIGHAQHFDFRWLKSTNPQLSVVRLSAFDYVSTINYFVMQSINQSVHQSIAQLDHQSLGNRSVVQPLDGSRDQAINQSIPLMSVLLPMSDSLSIESIARLVGRSLSLHSVDQVIITGSCSPLDQQSINRPGHHTIEKSFIQSATQCELVRSRVQALSHSLLSINQANNVSFYVPSRFNDLSDNQSMDRSSDQSTIQLIRQSVDELMLLAGSSYLVINHASEEGLLISELHSLIHPDRRSAEQMSDQSLSQSVEQVSQLSGSSQSTTTNSVHDLFGHTWMRGMSEQSLNPLTQFIRQTISQSKLRADKPLTDPAISRLNQQRKKLKIKFLMVTGVEGTGHHFIEQLMDQSIYHPINPINQSTVLRSRVVDRLNNRATNETVDQVWYEDLFPPGYKFHSKPLSPNDRVLDRLLGPSPGFIDLHTSPVDRSFSPSITQHVDQSISSSIQQSIKQSKMIVDASLTKYMWQYFTSDRLIDWLNVKVRLIDRITKLIDMYAKQSINQTDKQSIIIPINLLGAPYGMQSYPNMNGPDKMMHHPSVCMFDQLMRQLIDQSIDQPVDVSSNIVLIDRLFDSSVDSTFKRHHGDEIGDHLSYHFQAMGLMDNMAYLDWDIQSMYKANHQSFDQIAAQSVDRPTTRPTYQSNILHMSLTELTREPWRFHDTIDKMIERSTGSSINRLAGMGHSYKVDQTINRSLNQSMTSMLLDHSMQSLDIVRERVYTQPQYIFPPINRLVNQPFKHPTTHIPSQAVDHFSNFQCRSPHTLKRSLRHVNKYRRPAFPSSEEPVNHVLDQQVHQAINPIHVTLVSLEGSGENLIRWMIEQTLGQLTASVSPSVHPSSTRSIKESVFTPSSKQNTVPNELLDRSVDWLVRDRIALSADTRCSFDCDPSLHQSINQSPNLSVFPYEPQNYLVKMYSMSKKERAIYQWNYQSISQNTRQHLIDEMEGPDVQPIHQSFNHSIDQPAIRSKERTPTQSTSRLTSHADKISLNELPHQSDYIGSPHHPLIVLYRNPVDMMLNTASLILSNHFLHSETAKSSKSINLSVHHWKHRLSSQAKRLLEEINFFDEPEPDQSIHRATSSNDSSMHQTFAQHSSEYKQQSLMDRYASFLKSFPYQSAHQSKRILYVRYEDLTHHPRSELTRILKLMNILPNQSVSSYSQQTVEQSIDCVVDRLDRLMKGVTTSVCEVNANSWIKRSMSQSSNHSADQPSDQRYSHTFVDDMCGVATDSLLDRLIEQSNQTNHQSVKQSIDRGHARGLRHLTGAIDQANHQLPFKWLDLIDRRFWHSMMDSLGISDNLSIVQSNQSHENVQSSNNDASDQLEKLAYLQSLRSMERYIHSAKSPRLRKQRNS